MQDLLSLSHRTADIVPPLTFHTCSFLLTFLGLIILPQFPATILVKPLIFDFFQARGGNFSQIPHRYRLREVPLTIMGINSLGKFKGSFEVH